jgi:hypothetical protein
MVDLEFQMIYIENDMMKFLEKIKEKRKIRKLINSDNAIDVGVDVMLIVFDVLSSPILIVVRVLRYGFNKFIRGYVIRGIKWILNKLLGR